MTIIVDENLLGIWYVAYDNPRDIMAALSRTEKGRFISTYRVKYYATDGPPTADDRSEWHESVSPAGLSESYAIGRLRSFIDDVALIAPVAGRWEVLRGARSLKEFTDLITSMPCTHARKGSEAECRATEQHVAERRAKFTP